MFQPNFDPIYAALTSLLIGSNIPLNGVAVAGNAVLTGLGDTSRLSPGLAVRGVGVPAGDYIYSVDSTSQITLAAPMETSGAVSLSAGYTAMTVPQARLLRHWTDVGSSSQQPVLYVTQTGETSSKRVGQPSAWTLDTMVWVYAMAPNDSTPSAPALNTLLGLIRAVLFKDASGPGSVQNRQTLGGLVLDTWIEGKITTDNGFLGQQAVAKVPIRMIQNGP